MIIATEIIPEGDLVNRLIDFPHKYSSAKDLIWDSVFEFQNGQHESTVWSKYAADDEAIHAVGWDLEGIKRPQKPLHRYIGFLSILTRNVRQIRTIKGHGFAVLHMPEDDRPYHAAIEYSLAEGSSYAALTKTEKVDLKFALRKICGGVVADSRPAQSD